MAQPRICSLIKMKQPAQNEGFLSASGTGAPAATANTYQTGCIYKRTDGGAETSLYVNEGTFASPSWVSVLTTSNELQDLPDFGAMAYTAGKILVADGDSYEEVAVGGDATLASNGSLSVTVVNGVTAGDITASKAAIVDANKALRFGAFATGGASTGAVIMAAGLDKYSDGQLDVLSVFGASTSDLTGAYSAKCGRFRHLVVTSAGTVDHETYGLVGQCVVKGTTLTHLHAGIMGTFEGHTSGVVCNGSRYTVNHACITARLGGHAAITATTPIAGFLAFNNASAALAAGNSCAFATSSASASYPWTLGAYMPVGSVSIGLRIGNWAASGAAGQAIAFATTQNFNSDGQLGIVSCFGESATDLTSAYNAHVGRFRHLVSTSAASVAQETYGLLGQVVVKNSTLTHLHSGLLGTFEGNTTGSTLNSSYTIGHACVMARLGGHAQLTATTPIAGFLAFNNGAAALASGSSYAFATSMASASYPWSIGLCMPAGSVTEGIRVGAFASSYATGSAIPVSATTTAVASVFAETTADITSAYMTRAIRARHLVVTASATVNQETYGLQGQLCVKNTTLGHLHAGILGTLEADTAATVNGAYTYGIGAIIARVGGGGVITATKDVCGVVAFWNGAALASGSSSAFAVGDSAGTGTWTNALSIERASNVLYVPTASAYEAGIKVASITGIPDTTADGVIRVSVGGTPYYIPIFAAGSISGE